MARFKEKNGIGRLVVINLINRFFDGNNIAALLLGLTVVIVRSVLYMKYSVGHTVNIFESYLINFSQPSYILFMIIPAMLLFIDAPFIDDYSFVSVYRMKRRKWFYSNYIYIFVKTFLFNLMLLLASMFPLIFTGYIENRWSQTFLRMMKGYTEKIEKYYLAVPNKDLEILTPFTTLIVTIILFSLYITFLSEIIFSINMVSKRKYLGTVVVGILYFFIRYIDKEGMMLSETINKYAIRRNAIFPTGYCPELSDYKFSILYMILLNYIVYIFASTLYPFADFEESNNEN